MPFVFFMEETILPSLSLFLVFVLGLLLIVFFAFILLLRCFILLCLGHLLPSLAALCWKLVDQALAEAVAGLGFCCPSKRSCHFLGTACSDFVLPAFFGGRCLTYSTSQTLCIILLWCLASLKLDELRRLKGSRWRLEGGEYSFLKLNLVG